MILNFYKLSSDAVAASPKAIHRIIKTFLISDYRPNSLMNQVLTLMNQVLTLVRT